MPLRLRLFVYIGVVFLLITISSFFIEDYLIDRSLSHAQTDFKGKIEEQNKEKLAHLEAYVKECLIGYRTKINALLTLVKDYPEVRLNFNPIELRDPKKTWLDSSTLITNNKWIDIVQNIKNETLASSMLIDNESMPNVELYELFPNLKVTLLSQAGKKPVFVVAVPWEVQELFSDDSRQQNYYNSIKGNIADFYVLLKVDTLLNLDVDSLYLQGLNLSINPLYPFLKWIEVPGKTSLLNGFIQSLRNVQIAVKAHKEDLSEEKALNFKLTKKNKIFKKAPLAESNLDKLINRYEQIGLLWGYTTLIASGPFGTSPFDPNSPVGLVRTKRGESAGNLLLRHRVFFRNSSLDPGNSFTEDNLENVIRVILFKNRKDRCCFGNTLTLVDSYGYSKLTVGVDADIIFKELALVTNKDILFISNNKLVSVFNGNGEKLLKQELNEEDTHTLLKAPYGKISYKGEPYFFLQVVPFKDQDFHFCILSPESRESFLVDQLNNNLKWLVTRIGWQVGSAALGALIILLFLLDRIARKITKPIAALAEATELVKEGHFEDAFKVHENKKKLQGDEVHRLYEAFYNMVNGLKEKEKVRGILNKVVSTAIANEILKKELYLGGEEKEVTMFFSDIRSFTEITENMKPQEIVSMLNTCMTKISKVIDEYDGVIDKYVGDAVMALFGAPIAEVDSTLKAVLCAIEVIKILKLWNEEEHTLNYRKIEMGIGIHKGKVLVGNMGAQNRLNYTVIGANVNLASRLCSKAKPNEILISKEVYEVIAPYNRVEVEEMPPIELKGFSSKTEIYRVLGYKKKD